MSDDKIAEIRARHIAVMQEKAHKRYEDRNGAEAHNDRATLLAEVDRQRAEIKRLREDRRERIATAALQGLLSKWVGPPQQGADLAIQYADALIAELDKEEGKP